MHSHANRIGSGTCCSAEAIAHPQGHSLQVLVLLVLVLLHQYHLVHQQLVVLLLVLVDQYHLVHQQLVLVDQYHLVHQQLVVLLLVLVLLHQFHRLLHQWDLVVLLLQLTLVLVAFAGHIGAMVELEPPVPAAPVPAASVPAASGTFAAFAAARLAFAADPWHADSAACAELS